MAASASGVNPGAAPQANPLDPILQDSDIVVLGNDVTSLDAQITQGIPDQGTRLLVSAVSRVIKFVLSMHTWVSGGFASVKQRLDAAEGSILEAKGSANLASGRVDDLGNRFQATINDIDNKGKNLQEQTDKAIKRVEEQVQQDRDGYSSLVAQVGASLSQVPAKLLNWMHRSKTQGISSMQRFRNMLLSWVLMTHGYMG